MLLLNEIVAPMLAGVWPACQRVFAMYGQPRAFRMDTLGQQTSASAHWAKAQLYTGWLDDPWYNWTHPDHRVLAYGHSRWDDALIYIYEPLAREVVAIGGLTSGDHVLQPV